MNKQQIFNGSLALKGPSTSVDVTLHATVPKIVIGTKILYRLDIDGINECMLLPKVYIDQHDLLCHLGNAYF